MGFRPESNDWARDCKKNLATRFHRPPGKLLIEERYAVNVSLSGGSKMGLFTFTMMTKAGGRKQNALTSEIPVFCMQKQKHLPYHDRDFHGSARGQVTIPRLPSA
jgi:hypothetical protein